MSTWGQYPMLDQIVASTPPTPFGQEVLNNPQASDRMATDMQTLLPPPQGGVVDTAYGKNGRSFLTATDEDDSNLAFKIIKTIASAPFNVLRAGKQGLEEAIGHPNAQMRHQQDAMYDALAALNTQQKGLLGIPDDRTGLAMRQANGNEVGVGQPGSVVPIMQPRTTGWTEIFTGAERSRRARQMGEMKAWMDAQGYYLGLEHDRAKVASEKALEYERSQSGWRQGQEGIKAQNEGYEVAPNALAGRTKDYAQANQANAGAYANTARGDSIYSLLPSQMDRNTSAADLTRGRLGLVNAQTDQTKALTPAKVASTNALVPQREASARVGNARAATLERDGAMGGRPSVLDAAKAFNSANTNSEKRSTLAALDIKETKKPGLAGFLSNDVTPDWEGYKAKLDALVAPSAPKPTAPVPNAQPAGTPETGQVRYDIAKKAEAYRGLSKKAAIAAIQADLASKDITETEAYDIAAALGIERRR